MLMVKRACSDSRVEYSKSRALKMVEKCLCIIVQSDVFMWQNSDDGKSRVIAMICLSSRI